MINIETPVPRVTGFNDQGREYLSANKKAINYITRLVNGIDKSYDKEIMIAKIFSNVYNEDFMKIEQSLPYIKKTA